MMAWDRKHILMLVAGSLVALLVGQKLLVGPLYERFQTLAEQHEDLQSGVEKAQVLADRLPQAEADWKEGIRSLPTSDEAVAHPDAVIGHIQSLLTESKLTAQDLRFVNPEPGDEFDELIFQLKARASLKQLVAFLHAISVSPRPLRVETMSIARDDRTPGELTVDLRLAALVLATGDDS